MPYATMTALLGQGMALLVAVVTSMSMLSRGIQDHHHTAASLLDEIGMICDHYCNECVQEHHIKTHLDTELKPGGYEFVNPPTECEPGNCAHGKCFASNDGGDTQTVILALLDLFEHVTVGEATQIVARHSAQVRIDPKRGSVQLLDCNGGVIAYVERADLADIVSVNTSL